jgi:two-component system NtrC family sensor kinase
MRVHNIALVTELCPGLPLTIADPHRLKQVFLNLIVNAEQALEEAGSGGTLTIRSLMPPDRPGIIRLEFEDDGPGIPTEIMGRIFDPFFTTKEVGQGTGLGLSICYGIIAEHGGSIWAENVDGDEGVVGGAKFVIELPTVMPTVADSDSTGAVVQSSGQVASRLHLLVVDDEQDVIDLIRRIGRSAGHAVEAATDGAQALSLLEQESFDVVFCDLKMPGMSGNDLYRAVVERHPGIADRFVFVSGDTVNAATSTFVEETGRPLIMKPFTVAEILDILTHIRGQKPVQQ